MATSKERRKIAERLRIEAKTVRRDGNSLWTRLEIAVNGWNLGKHIDDSYALDNKVFTSLADLIDPTCKVVRKKVYAGGPQMHKTLWCCSECGFPLAESKCKGHVQFVAENFCPRCGARVVER